MDKGWGSEQQRRKPPKQHDQLAQLRHRLLTSLSQSNKTKFTLQSDRIFSECMGALFRDGQDSVYRLRISHQSSVCGSIWKKGKMAYRCQTCQVTPNSCICVECFRAGDHEGHDYYLYCSSCGGCCDCGNPEAWDPSGFCQHHGHQQQELSSSSSSSSAEENGRLDHDLSDCAIGVVRLMMDLLAAHLHTILFDKENKSSPFHCLERIETISTISREVCSFGDHLRSLFCQVVAETVVPTAMMEELEKSSSIFDDGDDEIVHAEDEIPSERMLMNLMLRGSCLLQNSAGESLSNFVLDLLFDVDFKVVFAKHYVSCYLSLLLISLEEEKANRIESALSTIGAQLFNFSGLVMKMVREEMFLHKLIKCLQIFFYQTIVLQNGGTVDCTKDIIKRDSFSRFFSDLSTIFKDPAVGEHLVFEVPKLFDQFLLYLSFLHGMNPNVRQVGQHVEYESDEWRYSFTLEMRLNILFPALVQGLKARFVGSPSPEVGAVALQSVLKPLLRRVWKQVSVDPQQIELRNSGQVEFVGYHVSKKPASFHIPLHRLFASLVKETTFQFPEEEFSNLLSIKPNEIMGLISHPLQIRAVMAQIQAGLWRRNGELTMMGQMNLYQRPSYTNQTLALDLLVLQIGAAMLPAPSFLLTLLDHFELLGWFHLESESLSPSLATNSSSSSSSNSSSSHSSPFSSFPSLEKDSEIDDGAYLIMAERFLHLLLTIVANRSMIGTEDPIRSHIIHWLCYEDQSYSNLVHLLSFEDQQTHSRHIEKLLEELAERRTVIDPCGRKESSLYHLRSQFWSEFDPTFLYYDQKHLQKAFENYGRVAPEGRAGALPMRSVADISLLKIFQNVTRPLYCDVLHWILFCVVYHAVYKTPRDSDKMLEIALYLISLLITLPNPPSSFSSSSESGSPSSSPLSPSPSPSSRPPSSPSPPSFFSHQGKTHFPSTTDFLENAFCEIKTPNGPRSLVHLLCKLSKEDENRLRRNFVLNFLSDLSSRFPDYTPRLEAIQSSSGKKFVGNSLAKSVSLERKASVMAKFSAMQKEFDKKITDFLSSDDEEDEEDEDVEMADTNGDLNASGGGGGGSQNLKDSLRGSSSSGGKEKFSGHESLKCELCKDGPSVPWTQKPIGLIGMVTRSNVVASATRRSRYRLCSKKRKKDELDWEFGSQMGGNKLMGEEKKEFEKKGKEKAERRTASGEKWQTEREEEKLHLLEAFSDESRPIGYLLGNPAERGRGMAILLRLFAQRAHNDPNFFRGVDTLGGGGERSDSDESDEDSLEVSDDSYDLSSSSVDLSFHGGLSQRSQEIDNEGGSSSSQSPRGDMRIFSEPAHELFSHRSGETMGTHFNSCGHTIHLDCLKRYMAVRDLDMGEMFMDKMTREFWCPVCRRVSNILIPLIPDSLMSCFDRNFLSPSFVAKDSEQQLVQWLVQSQRSAFLLLSNEPEVEKAKSDLQQQQHTSILKLMAKCADKVWIARNHKKGEKQTRFQMTLGLIECLIYSVMSTELAARTPWPPSNTSKFLEGMKRHQIAGLRDLARLLTASIQSGFPEDMKARCIAPSLLVTIVQCVLSGESSPRCSSNEELSESSSSPSVDQDRSVPFLSLNMFSLFVRWILTLLEPPLPLPFYRILFLCYIASVIQAVIVVLNGVCDDDDDSEEDDVKKGGKEAEKEEEENEEETEKGKEEDMMDVGEEGEDPKNFDNEKENVSSSSSSPSNLPSFSPETFLNFGQDEQISVNAIRRLVCAHFGGMGVDLELGRRNATAKKKRDKRKTKSSSKWEKLSLSQEEEKEFYEKVQLFCLPFLRQCLLFQRICYLSTPEAGGVGEETLFDVDQKMNPHVQFEAIRNHFGLPPLSCLGESLLGCDKRGGASFLTTTPNLFNSSSSSSSSPLSTSLGLLISRWVFRFSQSRYFNSPNSDAPPSSSSSSSPPPSPSPSSPPQSPSSPSSSSSFFLFGSQKQKEEKDSTKEKKIEVDLVEKMRLSRIPAIAPFDQFQLVPLPILFQDLFHSYLDTSCDSCNKVPEDSALCLVCGAFLCLKSSCCTADNFGEVFRHAITCGAGSAIFLCLRRSAVFLVRDGRYALWGSPYLDVHGEDDVHLDRGRPLHLDQEVYLSLNYSLLSHTLDDIILKPPDNRFDRRPRDSLKL